MPALFDIVKRPLSEVVQGASSAAVACDMEQGSGDWFGARTGIVTASCADKVVTSKGEPTKGEVRKSYLHGLIAERLTGTTEMQHVNAAMERGTNLEPKARNWYSFERGFDVLQVGFVYGGAGEDWGCSPDGLIASGRGLEIKCPMRRQMVKVLLAGKMPTDYVAQVQFSMWVCGLDEWDFVCYTPEPELRRVIWTQEKDEKLHAAFAEHIPAFCAEVAAGVAHIEAMEDN